MKKILYACLLFAGLTSCSKDDNTMSTPSEVSNITAKAIVGGAVVKWELPSDSGFTYVEVSYEKNGEIIRVPVSKYTDSLVVENLLNKFEYTFEVRTVNYNKEDKVYGKQTLSTESIRPIRRPIETVYYDIDLKDNMLETYTQESTEGPKSALVDNNISTYWHTAWSSGVASLPHWIKVNFTKEQSVDRIGYYFRQGRSNAVGRPTKIAFETSSDGVNWSRVWESSTLNVSNDIATKEQIIDLDKTYTSKYSRVMFLEVNGTTDYVNLGEFSLYYKEDTDLELKAEKLY